MFEGIHEVSVLVSALLAVAVGNIWYSPVVFGKYWMRAAGSTIHDTNLSDKELFVSVLKAIVVQGIFFYMLAHILRGALAFGASIFEISLLVASVIGVQILSIVIWERKPLSYFFVHAGYISVVTFGGLAVISYWPW